jgi:hypothetical protein
MPRPAIQFAKRVQDVADGDWRATFFAQGLCDG